ncbi:MAG TPA: GNAT family N-acetyltransferase [Kofleriaceae bacterium]
MLQLIDVAGSAIASSENALARAEALHRELRPDLAADYASQLEQMMKEGARVVHLVDDGEPRALAVWRLFHTTYCGRRLEVEDLVTSSTRRSNGYGATLLRWLGAQGRAAGCQTITLHSATHRDRAHRFYFREGYHILAFHFSKRL